MKHLRRWINKHSSIVTVISVAVLILALGWIVQEVRFRWNRSAVIPDAWFYDLNTGQLFRAKSNGLPPIAAPSGPLPNGKHAGVRAKVFACGDCSDPSNRFIGWLEKLTPEVKYAITDEHAGEWEGFTSMNMPYLDGLLVQAVNGEYWYKATSQDGRVLMEAPRKRCTLDKVLNSCFPD